MELNQQLAYELTRLEQQAARCGDLLALGAEHSQGRRWN